MYIIFFKLYIYWLLLLYKVISVFLLFDNFKSYFNTMSLLNINPAAGLNLDNILKENEYIIYLLNQ